MIIKTHVIMWSIWFLLLTQLSVYETADDNEIILGACDEPPSHHHHHHHHHHHRRHHSEIYEPSRIPENQNDFFPRKYNSWPYYDRCSLFDSEFNNPPTRRRWTFGGFGTKNRLTKEEKQRQKEEEQIRKIERKTEKLKQKMEKDNQAWEKEQAKMKEEKSKLMRQMLAPTCQKKRLFRKTF